MRLERARFASVLRRLQGSKMFRRLAKKVLAAERGMQRIRPGSSHDFARIATQKPSGGDERS
jgi:hypothetical protein